MVEEAIVVSEELDTEVIDVEYVDPKKPLFSFSKFRTYMHCPSKYKFTYVDKQFGDTHPALLVGTSVHQMSENFSNSVLVGNPKSMQEIMDEGRNFWNETVAEKLPSLPPGESLFHFTQALDMFEAYFPLLKETKPKFVEKHIVHYPTDKKYGFQGVLDRLDDDNRLADIKTTAKTPSRSKKDYSKYNLQPTNDMQLATYAWLADEKLGIQVREAYIDFIVKSTPAKAVRVELEINRKLIDSVLDSFDRVYEAISAGFFPPNRTCSSCNPNWCPFWTQCTGLPIP